MGFRDHEDDDDYDENFVQEVGGTYMEMYDDDDGKSKVQSLVRSFSSV